MQGTSGVQDLGLQISVWSAGLDESRVCTDAFGCMWYCRPMINKPPRLKGLSIRIPIIIPTKGRGFKNQGSGLVS